MTFLIHLPVVETQGGPKRSRGILLVITSIKLWGTLDSHLTHNDRHLIAAAMPSTLSIQNSRRKCEAAVDPDGGNTRVYAHLGVMGGFHLSAIALISFAYQGPLWRAD